MKNFISKIVPHFIITSLFVIISLLFFYPILQGKQIIQSDIVQYNAMAKERNEFRNTRESYWTNSAFGGMPTYQLGANYANDYVKHLDKIIRFLPRPADYLFLYFIGFYILLLTLKIGYRYAFIGALSFGFSTYLLIILNVGHNAKAHAIGYFAWVISGIILTFIRKYFWGFLLTSISLALEIGANHFQMTYYLLLLVLVLTVVEFTKAIQKKLLPNFLKSIGVISVAGIFALLLNATSLLTTWEYTQFSTRGSSELTLTPKGEKKKSQSGLSKDYITEYSYGISESMNLIVPRLFGGSNSEKFSETSHTYTFLTQRGISNEQALQFVSHLPSYWGKQPIVAAPAYVGIVLFFLFILGFFILDKYIKYWLVFGTLLSLILSWGKNFAPLTNLMIDYFPLYNKFRAVSSIQVLLEFCLPIMGILSLYKFSKQTKQYKKPLYYTLAIVSGILILLLIGKNLFSFEGIRDYLYIQNYGTELMQAIIEDRKQAYSSDILRSLFLTGLIFVLLMAYHLQKLSAKILPLFAGILILSDLLPISFRYMSEDNFVSKTEFSKPFKLSTQEKQILNDKEHFRVFNLDEGLNGARTSYFFKSIGGYHAAKPKAIQELFDYQIYKNNPRPLDMLNVKYLITTLESGEKNIHQNTNALGNAWFIKNLYTLASSDAIMQSLDTLTIEKYAVTKNLKTTHYQIDSLSKIHLKSYEPDRLIYESNNRHKGFAVFSEIFYPYGWEATIDGNPTAIYKVNFALRGIEIPQGKHQIEFRFAPKIVNIGQRIVLFSSIIWIFLVFGLSALKFKNQFK